MIQPKKGVTEDEYQYDTSGYLEFDENLDNYAVYGNLSVSKVGTKLPNTLRLYDMSGNVSEYVNDTNSLSTGDYINPLVDTSNGSGTASRIIRGGSVSSSYAAYYNCVIYRTSQSGKSSVTGFRLCRTMM